MTVNRTLAALLAVPLVIALRAPVAFSQITSVQASSAPATSSEDGDVSDDTPVVTHHVGVFHGKKISYSATAGRLPITGPDGSVDAQLFYVAYTMDSAKPGSRPITFLANGGPGAATAWLHLGGIGPRKIAMNVDGSTPPSPATVIDNPDSPLDRTDLIFIDGPGTGFSRLSGDSAKGRLLTKQGDLDTFASFIQGYLRQYSRFGSPLYLFGESYGAFRMAGLTDVLIRRGVPLKGAILLSSAIDFTTLTPTLTNDLPYVLDIPSYASVSGFHHLLDPSFTNTDAVRAEAEQWAIAVYAPALAKGSALAPAERAIVVRGLTRYTGLPTNVIEMHNLRIDIPDYMKYLNAARGVVTGRTDGRLVGPAPAGRVEEPFYDPAMGAMTPAFTSAASQYLFGELKFDSRLSYRMYSRDVAQRFQLAPAVTDGTEGYPETLGALQSTMVKNKDFRVLSVQGLYDLATPYMSMKFALAHMPLPAEYQRNIRFVLIPAGHMAYADAIGLRQLNDAVISFIDEGASDGAVSLMRTRRRFANLGLERKR